jgi:hypothetical protein
MRAYEEFTGHAAGQVAEVQIEHPTSAAVVGRLVGVAYEAVRNGQTIKYMHEFAAGCEPTLAVAPGKQAQLLIVGGSYTFTDHGIVDVKPRRSRKSKR